MGGWMGLKACTNAQVAGGGQFVRGVVGGWDGGIGMHEMVTPRRAGGGVPSLFAHMPSLSMKWYLRGTGRKSETTICVGPCTEPIHPATC